jgi:POT family proton-dependent oligopeptide transporter
MYVAMLILTVIFFYATEFQVATILIDNAAHFFKMNVYSIKIPAGITPSLESVFVVLIAFAISHNKIKGLGLSGGRKISLGIAGGILAFGILFWSTLYAQTSLIGFLWLVVASLFLAIGDVCIMPPVIALVTRLIPEKFKGRIVAGLYFSLAWSAYLSGKFSGVLSRGFENANSNIIYYRTNFIYALVTLGVLFTLSVVVTRVNSIAHKNN